MTVPPPTPDTPDVNPRQYSHLVSELMCIEDMSKSAAKRFIRKRGKQAAEQRIRSYWKDYE